MTNVKYLFVLRGDTPTRLCFYQCFAFGVCPIIYEKDLVIYSKLLLSDNINILNSVLIIPNKEENMSCEQYCEIVEKILEKELITENNYVNKIKNHEQIFNNFNYFKTPLCYPIKNAVEHIKSLVTQLKPANPNPLAQYGRQYISKYDNQYIRNIYHNNTCPYLRHRLDTDRYYMFV